MDKMKQYDYLIIGAGLFGSVFANRALNKGKRCLVIDKRNHIAGNSYTEDVEGIQVHRYGAHIFHTANEAVWRYVNQFSAFNRYTNSPIANYRGTLYNLPFNMNTFYQLWGTITPAQAKEKLEQQIPLDSAPPCNLEEQAISLVGEDIYEKLIRGYTEKQWGRSCKDLPAFIIKRLPIRFTYDNNYFDDPYQGIPLDGYTKMVERMLSDADVRLNCDYLQNKSELDSLASCKIYTGPIDAYFNFCYGSLEYRSLRFETEMLDISNYQGNAVVNYTDRETPYTRIVEHKHFTFGNQSKTVITKEYPAEFTADDDPYYPINDDRNQILYQKYATLAKQEPSTLFGGRLAEYKYYNMDQVIARALELSAQID